MLLPDAKIKKILERNKPKAATKSDAKPKIEAASRRDRSAALAKCWVFQCLNESALQQIRP